MSWINLPTGSDYLPDSNSKNTSIQLGYERHSELLFQNLTHTHDALARVLDSMDNNITGDFLAMDIRQALQYLGEITDAITTEDLLENIFSKFCIGK